MRFAVLAIAAFALAACGQTTTATTTTQQADAAAQQGGGKPTENVPAPSSGKPVTAMVAPTPAHYGAQQLLGRWGDDGDCTKNLVEFHPDGDFHSFQSNADGRWSLSGQELTMSGSGGVFNLHLNWIDADHMNVVSPDGSVGHSQRC